GLLFRALLRGTFFRSHGSPQPPVQSRKIVTNSLLSRTRSVNKKSVPTRVGTLSLDDLWLLGQRWHAGFVASAGRGPGTEPAFADFEPRKAPNRDVLAKLGDGVVHHLADRHALILDEVLFVKAVLFVELFHLAVHDALHHVLRLAGRERLRFVNFALLLQHFLRHFLATHIARI